MEDRKNNRMALSFLLNNETRSATPDDTEESVLPQIQALCSLRDFGTKRESIASPVEEQRVSRPFFGTFFYSSDSLLRPAHPSSPYGPNSDDGSTCTTTTTTTTHSLITMNPSKGMSSPLSSPSSSSCSSSSGSSSEGEDDDEEEDEATFSKSKLRWVYNNHSLPSSPSSSSASKISVQLPERKRRRRVGGDQRLYLESAFRVNSFPSTDEKLALARMLHMELKHVHSWFQNKRATLKRKAKRAMARAQQQQQQPQQHAANAANSPTAMVH